VFHFEGALFWLLPFFFNVMEPQVLNWDVPQITKPLVFIYLKHYE
jgi:hypothetical protein